jgi:23S rRNA pseudouridine2605 synthase
MMRSEPERLHKLLAQHGIGSRREVEKWMLAGRVLLNGKPAQPGDRYRDGDRVVVDGQEVTARLRITGKAEVLAYHKPQGQPVTATTEDGAAESASGLERLPAVRGSRWLVINTMQPGDSGLLLLTSDGRLADALRRRSENIPSVYVARVLVPTPEFDPRSLQRLVQFNDQPAQFESITPAGGEGTNRWFRVEAAHSHRRAAVRALFETQGLKVSRVIQLKFADVELPRELPRGKHQALTEGQVARLYDFAEIEQPVPERAPARAPRRAADRQRKPARRPSAARAAKPARATSKRATGKHDRGDPAPGRGGRKPTARRRSDR